METKMKKKTKTLRLLKKKNWSAAVTKGKHCDNGYSSYH